MHIALEKYLHVPVLPFITAITYCVSPLRGVNFLRIRIFPGFRFFCKLPRVIPEVPMPKICILKHFEIM